MRRIEPGAGGSEPSTQTSVTRHTSSVPFFLIGNTEHPLHHGRHLEASDDEHEGLGPIGGQDLAVLDGEVVQRVDHVAFGRRFLLEADELAVVLQDEVSRPPVPDVFACKENMAVSSGSSGQ